MPPNLNYKIIFTRLPHNPQTRLPKRRLLIPNYFYADAAQMKYNDFIKNKNAQLVLNVELLGTNSISEVLALRVVASVSELNVLVEAQRGLPYRSSRKRLNDL